MTNHAAQTMPESGSWIAADDVYRHARTIDVALNGEAGAASRPALCDVVAQIASLARKHGPLAAALSQTAGVVSDEMVERACKKYAFREDGALWPDAYGEHEVIAERTLMREFLEHALAAAPAASGGEDGWSLAMRVREALDRESCPDHFMRIAVETITGDAPQPPSAASVSERARELEQAQRLAVSLWQRNYKESSPDWKVDETLTGVLLQISNMVSGMSLRSNADDRLADLVVSLRDRAKWGRGGKFTSPHDSEGTSRLLDMAADAIEQALAQQRGSSDPVAWRAQWPGGAYTPWISVDDEDASDTKAMAIKLGARFEFAFATTTTPQPGAEALRELVQRWRISASVCGESEYSDGARDAFSQCADELESLLGRGG